MNIEKVHHTSHRITPLESLIQPTPPRWDQGAHYIGSVDGQDVGYVQIVPLIWLNGQIIPIPSSYWCYIARVAVTRPQYLAPLYRACYKVQKEFQFPLTLIAKPTPGPAEIFNTRLGFQSAPFAGGWLVKHCPTSQALPLMQVTRQAQTST